MEKIEYSPIHRIMHWAIALCMTFLLLTIFLRSTWMSRDSISGIINDTLKDTDISLSKEQVGKIARNIRRPMWDWHIYIGYVLTGLYCFRLLLPAMGEMKFQWPFRKSLETKIKFKLSTYLLFYVCVFISLVTGLLIEWGPQSIKEILEEIHGFSLYYLLVFMFLHFSGIILAEIGSERGIVSRMIGGK